MANPMRGEVPFEVDGKSYRLSFSVNALCELEDHLGQGIADIVMMLQDPSQLRLSQVRAVFWAGLRDHHAEVDLVGAGSLMGVIGNVEAIEMIGTAFALSFPDAPEGSNRPLAARGKSPRGIGRRS